MRAAALLAVLVVAACAGGRDPAPPPRDAAPPPHETPLSGPLSEAEFAALHTLREDAAPPAKGVSVDLPGAGSKAYLSLPPGEKAPLPGVVVIHEWWGLNDHIRHATDRLAAEGYAALAVDLYDGQVATTREQAQALTKGVEPESAKTVLAAARRFLVDDARVRAPRTAVLGWCFGGKWALEDALAQPQHAAAVVYYGQLVSDRERLRALRPPLLGVFGTRDASLPVERVREFETALRDLGKEHRIVLYDAEHAFANPSGGRYDAKAAAAAWEETRAWLERWVR